MLDGISQVLRTPILLHYRLVNCHGCISACPHHRHDVSGRLIVPEAQIAMLFSSEGLFYEGSLPAILHAHLADLWCACLLPREQLALLL